MTKKEKISPVFKEEDRVLDLTLRPQSLRDYVGQRGIKKNIEIMVGAAQKRKESSVEHILFYGGSGLGKTTLSYLIAREMNSKIRSVAGPSIKKSGDLAALLTNLKKGDVLFIDEIHRMNRTCEEIIYPVMEEFNLNLVIGKGPMARTMDLKIPRFTLIGATTRLALLSSPLRSRFGATLRLDSYNIEEIREIIKRSAKILQMRIKKEGINAIAQRSRFNPRIANRLLKRVRDFSDLQEENPVTEKTVEKALSFLDIDVIGLESGDRKILQVLLDKFDGGPAGLQSISLASGEEEETIIEVYEPYLIQSGLLKRTRQGRVLTEKAKKYLKKEKKNGRT